MLIIGVVSRRGVLCQDHLSQSRLKQAGVVFCARGVHKVKQWMVDECRNGVPFLLFVLEESKRMKHGRDSSLSFVYVCVCVCVCVPRQAASAEAVPQVVSIALWGQRFSVPFAPSFVGRGTQVMVLHRAVMGHAHPHTAVAMSQRPWPPATAPITPAPAPARGVHAHGRGCGRGRGGHRARTGRTPGL